MSAWLAVGGTLMGLGVAVLFHAHGEVPDRMTLPLAAGFFMVIAGFLMTFITLAVALIRAPG